MSETHYVIEAQSQDWIFVILKMLKRYNLDAGQATQSTTGETIRFHIPRNALSPDDLAATIGSTAKRVSGTNGKIVLTPFTKMADWPQPTVNTYGTA